MTAAQLWEMMASLAVVLFFMLAADAVVSGSHGALERYLIIPGLYLVAAATAWKFFVGDIP